MASQAITNVRSRSDWAAIIRADWRRSIDSFIQTGRDLLAAKEELSHGEFGLMLASDLNMKAEAASRLMAVASHPIIANTQNSDELPQTFSVLIELSPLPKDDYLDAKSKGLITPNLTVKAARAITGAYRKPEGEVVGGAQHMLPSPKEAREIARATGRFVAASDNNIYSGATESESRAYTQKRNEAFRILEAIDTIADAPDPREWLKGSEKHWFADFRPGAMDEARKWLGNLKEAMEIVDAH